MSDKKAKKIEKIKIHVSRFNPEEDKEPEIRSYEVEKYPGMRAVEALEQINSEQGANIAFDHSCKEWHCGTCTVKINGEPKPLCREEIMDNDLIDPLPLPIIRDLVTDRSELEELHTEIWEANEWDESVDLDESIIAKFRDFGSCMECDICYFSCPFSFMEDKEFIGPEHMAKIYRYHADPRADGVNLNFAEKWGVWDCVTCLQCDEKCPKDVLPKEGMLKLRQALIESPKTRIPSEIRDLNESIYTRGNPYGEAKSARTNWKEDMDVKTITNGNSTPELLFFVGCAQSYDNRSQEVARSITKVLKEADLDFGILGTEEKCCGDVAKNTGEQGLYKELIGKNTESLTNNGVKRILTACPHGYNSFKNDYPLDDIKIMHYVTLFQNLIKEEKITFSNKLDKRITYHDPCYLGRYNGIYEEPREIIKSLPGVEMVEMERTKENSFCCGGGGGGNWREPEGEPRASEIRVNEAKDLNPDIIAVACPFCLSMLEDAVKTLGCEETIQVKQISELVNDAI